MAYTTRHVNSHTGVNNFTCLEGSIPCATLAYALEDLHDDTTVLLENDVVSHPNITTVQDGPISNISISSSRGSTLINCSEEGGFAFINVDGLSITNVEFHNCGALRNSTSYNAHGDPLAYTVSLYLYNCTDVSLVSTTVSNSPGAGVVMLAVTGCVEIVNSTFIGNGRLVSRKGYNYSRTSETEMLAGGGLLVELPSCPLGVSSNECCGSSTECFQNCSLPWYNDVTYAITNTLFSNNTAETPDFNTNSFLDNPQITHFTAIGRGGGLSVFVKGRTENISVVVSECSFDNNWALYGGGLFMETWHYPTNVSLEVFDSSFTRNALPYNSVTNTGTGGGGLRYNEPYCDGTRNTLLVKGCTFDSNRAFWGGGSSITFQSEDDQSRDGVVLVNCTYTRNTARLGAATDLTHYIGHPTVVLQDVVITENSNQYSNNSGYISGEGVVYLYLVRLLVKSTIEFGKNEGSGISSFSSVIHFLDDSTSLFYDNHAFRGAALALYGGAAIVLHKGSQLNFTENKADTVGGAIYHAILGNRALFDNGACPIRMSAGLNWSHTDLWFVNNSAAQGRGMSIYTYSIYPCVERGVTKLNETLYWSAFNYECDEQKYPDCFRLQVSGDGSIIQPNEGLSLKAFPGEIAALPFNVADGQNKGVKVPFEAIITSNDGNAGYSIDVLNSSSVLVTGLPSNKTFIRLHSIEPQTVQVRVDLEIIHCPPGYLLDGGNDDKQVCQCKIDSSFAGLSCDGKRYRTILNPSYWIGYTDEGAGFHSGLCPSGFCHSRSLSLNGSDHFNSTSLDKVVCGPQRRTGVLCGKCKEGYGVSFYQPFPCVPCNDSSSRLTVNGRHYDVLLIWFVTEFVPLNVVFLLFILFNVNILSGWGGALYTFVFFCQVVTTSPVFLANNVSIWGESSGAFIVFLSINRFLANLWSLNFFSFFVPPEHTCFSRASYVQVAITGAYFTLLLWPLFLYIFLSAIHRCYRRGYCCSPAHRCLFRMGKTLSKCQKSEGGGVNSLAGLCSFFVLAYTKLVILTWEILSKAEVHSSNGDSKMVFWYNGTVPWFDRDLHAPYAVPILLCSLVTVMVPTLLLVSFPLLPKLLVKLNLHERRPFCWIISLLNKSYLVFLYDIFQGCFKPKARYFAALYLLYRHLFVMVWAFADSEAISFWQIIISVYFTLFHSLAQPFKNDKVNKLTSVIFAILILILFLSNRNFNDSQLEALRIWRRPVIIVFLFTPHAIIATLILWRAVCIVRKRCRKRGAPDAETSTADILEMQTSQSNTDSDHEWSTVKHIFNRHREPSRENALLRKSDEGVFSVANLSLGDELLSEV